MAVLFFLMWYLCHNFMDYQKNATSQVNKYRVDQVCMLSDGSMVVQKFEAKHTHLKTVKLYFSNDYSGVATGKLILNIVDMETGKSVAKVSRKISNLKDFDYTDFNTDVQLQKGIIMPFRSPRWGRSPEKNRSSISGVQGRPALKESCRSTGWNSRNIWWHSFITR